MSSWQGKPPAQEVDIWNDGKDRVFRPGQLRLIAVEDQCDVFVRRDMLDQAEVTRVFSAAHCATMLLKVAGLDMALIAVERVLRLGGGLPLVAPDHVETGTIESEMEASDACEKLRGSRAAAGLTTGRERSYEVMQALPRSGRVRGSKCSPAGRRGTKGGRVPTTASPSQAGEDSSALWTQGRRKSRSEHAPLPSCTIANETAM